MNNSNTSVHATRHAAHLLAFAKRDHDPVADAGLPRCTVAQLRAIRHAVGRGLSQAVTRCMKTAAPENLQVPGVAVRRFCDHSGGRAAAGGAPLSGAGCSPSPGCSSPRACSRDDRRVNTAPCCIIEPEASCLHTACRKREMFQAPGPRGPGTDIRAQRSAHQWIILWLLRVGAEARGDGTFDMSHSLCACGATCMRQCFSKPACGGNGRQVHVLPSHD